MPQVLLIKDEDEFQDLLEKNTEKLIVVDFYATWCGPCKMISPKVEAMVSDYPDVVFAKIDVDDEAVSEIISKYKIQSMPTFLFIKNKEAVDSMSGANEEKLRSYVTKFK